LIVAVAKGWLDVDENLRRSMETFIGSALLQFDCFLDAFLLGWSSSSFRSSGNTNVAPLVTSNKLPILNKLGKYGSIQVKKLIADYVGVRYGERRVTVLEAHRRLH
jgi:hypothetical protein